MALTGLTAVISIETTLKLQRGETILIQGGAGGVASFAIQLAKHLGARVITITSTANLDYVRGLGADEVIDYNARDFTQAVSGCEAVFDTVGGDVALKSFCRIAARRPSGLYRFRADGAEA
jgi:NADPH:quinone reductase-like Zn-dependent oxidoreductase